MLFLGVTALCFSALNVHAFESPVNRKQSDKARALTVEAVKLIEKKKWDEAQRKIAESKDPLAAKIFYWLQLTGMSEKDWTNELFIRLAHFVRDNPEWPSIKKMVVRAEGVMPEGLSNDEVIAWYTDFPPQTPYGMGRYMDALIINGEHEKARAFLADWWASTLTSRSQQKEIFKKFGGYLTIEAHKKRFDALLHHGHYDSAQGIADVLGQGYPALAKARAALSKNKSSGIGALIDAVPEYLKDDPGLLYERLRWRRKRGLDSGAVEILMMDIDKSDVLNQDEWWQERHIIIRRLLEKKKYKLAYEVASRHLQDDGFENAQAQWMSGWLALRFMNKPTEAYERFIAMHKKVSTPVSKSRAAYWAGRAASQMGQKEIASGWYKEAAQYKTVFYGQMAGAALSKEIGLPKSNLPTMDRSDYKKFEKDELFQASEVFKEAKQNIYADRFLNAFLAHYETPKAYRFAAEKLAKEDDFFSAVKIAKKASRKGLLLTKQAYPTITKHLGDIHGAEWALIHALIRQESMFDYDAQSHAGALGLMQLMPSTAKHVSKKMNVGYSKEWLTENPKYNLHLGAYYIGEMVDRFDGSYPVAIAAYNAGPGRVGQWLETYGDPRKGEIDMIDWIEILPVYETRNYVQRVLENVYVYRLRLNNIQLQPSEKIHIAFHTSP